MAKEKRGWRQPDPAEVIDQVNTWAWLIGNLPNDNSITDDQVFGLYSIGHMIAHNVEDAIHDLQLEVCDLRHKLEAGGSGEA